MRVKTILIATFVLCVAVGLRLLLSYYSLINLPPSSDEAIAILMAEGIADASHYPLLFIGQPYQFPIEAYLMAPFVESMPNNSFGARYQVLALGALSCLGFLIAASQLLSKAHRWPSILLILIPSAYWLTWQSGYAAPQYAISSVFAATMFYLAAKIFQQKQPKYGLSFIFGIIAGLSLSNHLLLISIVVGTAIANLSKTNFKQSSKRLASYFSGLLIGLLPLFLALYLLPNAYEKLTSRLPLSYTFQRIFDMVLPRTLPGSLGANPPIFGDYPTHIAWGDAANFFVIAIFLLIFIIALSVRIYRFVIDSSKKRSLCFEWPDMFLITSMLTIFLMAGNARSGWADHRYLLPLVWSFPFLVAYVYALSSRGFTRFMGAIVALLAVFNMASSAAIIDQWRQPEEIRRHADIPHLGNIQDWMSQQGINYCYATFWLAYRFTYEADGKILCAPAYNERFIDWPVPYKATVDRQENVAYVMSNTYGTKFNAKKFQSIMQQQDVQFQLKRFGSLYVFYDFRWTHASGGAIVPSQHYVLNSNIKTTDFDRLSDAQSDVAWSDNTAQKAGHFIEARFDQPQKISSIVMRYPVTGPFAPKSLSVQAFYNHKWHDISEELPFSLDHFRFDQQHPIFGEMQQTLHFPVTETQKIRIQIKQPKIGGAWNLSELTFYAQ